MDICDFDGMNVEMGEGVTKTMLIRKWMKKLLWNIRRMKDEWVCAWHSLAVVRLCERFTTTLGFLNRRVIVIIPFL